MNENLIPQFKFEKCVNCNGYGAIGRDPRIQCPTCKGLGAVKIPLVPVNQIMEGEK